MSIYWIHTLSHCCITYHITWMSCERWTVWMCLLRCHVGVMFYVRRFWDISVFTIFTETIYSLDSSSWVILTTQVLSYCLLFLLDFWQVEQLVIPLFLNNSFGQTDSLRQTESIGKEGLRVVNFQITFKYLRDPWCMFALLKMSTLNCSVMNCGTDSCVHTVLYIIA